MTSNKRPNFSLAQKSLRSHQRDFLTGNALQNIEARDRKKMRAKVPAYQIYASAVVEQPKGFAATQNVFYSHASVDSSGPSIFKPQSSFVYDDEQTLLTSSR